MSLNVLFTHVTCSIKQQDGERRINGNYIPAKGDTNARFITRVVDQDGEYRQITFWNRNGDTPGKGFADIAAKWITNGRMVSFQANEKVVRDQDYRNPDNGYAMVIDPETGKALKQEKVYYTAIPGTLKLSSAAKDSFNQVADEIKNFDPANPSVDPFFRRPPNWNVENHADQAIFKDLMKARTGATYIEGNEYYGHARVGMAKKGSSNAHSDESKVQNAVNNNDVVQAVGGVTLQALRDNNWTDAQIMSSEKYNVLLPKKVEVPAPPAEVPAPPQESQASSDGADEPIYA